MAIILVRFQNKVDYGMALTQGPWIVFGHYFTVQPWMVDFMLGPLVCPVAQREKNSSDPQPRIHGRGMNR
ncbi:hypothetical protein Golob_025980, partial [Gossypium lobatum]|nr:hypothetical protein [Gossypium lobatum]